MKISFVFFTTIMLLASCQYKNNNVSTIATPPLLGEKIGRMHGLSFVAPPEEFPQNPMSAIQAVAADWIAVIPYAFTKPKDNRVIFNAEKWQWWGESPAGISKSIELAHEANIKVMLKPQVYFPHSWSGYLDFEKESDWQQWESDYVKYIMTFVKIAAAQKVEMFCIGTEFKNSVTKREVFWRKLIADIKKEYQGKLTYSSNWDEFSIVPFWNELDYIGVNAYFPLLDEKTPTIDALAKLWEGPLQNMKAIQEKYKKPILFTEYGYLSVDRCTFNSWELEAKIEQISINEVAQANAIAALWKRCSQEPWWVGGFLWKWFPNMRGHEGYPEKDYTPQGKKAEPVLKEMHLSY